MGQEAHLGVQEGMGCLARGLGGVARPTQRSRKGREAHPEVWEGLESHPRFRRG